MAPPELLSTALDISLPKRWLPSTSRSANRGVSESSIHTARTDQTVNVDPEFMLPKRTSLVIIIVTNVLLQVCRVPTVYMKSDIHHITDLVLHNCLVVKLVRGTSRGNVHVCWCGHWYSYADFWYMPRSLD